MGAMSVSHWLIVVVVVLVFFGPKKLGSLGQSLAEGIRGFQNGLSDKHPGKASENQDSTASPAESKVSRQLESARAELDGRDSAKRTVERS